MTIPVKEKLTIFKGGVFRHRYRVLDANSQPVNLTNYTARMHIRESWEASTAAIELTSANARITITAATGLIDLYISATDTAALSISSGVFDLEAVPQAGDSAAIKLAYGSVRVMPEATK